MAPTAPSRRRWRLLTVGDGDLSFSLALLRCYTLEQIDLTISTPASSLETLIQQYPSAREIVREIDAYSTAAETTHTLRHRPRILYGIDAGALHSTPCAPCSATSSSSASSTLDDDETSFDLILFQYPHVGIDPSVSEATLRDRNIVLLHRYLYSAAHRAPYVHVTLLPNQARSWRLAQPDYATIVHVVPVQRPVHQAFPPLEGRRRDWRIHPPPPSRRRRAHRHFLAPYGYRHVRTLAAATERVDLAGSCHYVLQVYAACGRPPPFRGPGEEEPQLSNETKAVIPTTPKQKEEHVNAAADRGASVPRSESPLLSELANVVTIEYRVTEEQVGTRLRSFLCQVGPGSKRQWERWIRSGAVSIGPDVVRDAARILHGGTVTTRIPPGVGAVARGPAPPVVATWTVGEEEPHPNGWVVRKPVGMRTRGNFHAATLEQCLARSLGAVRSLNNLDKGCRGLCVLQSMPGDPRLLLVRQTFTALVYGHGPPHWKSGSTTIVLPVDGVRRWKKPRKLPTEEAGEPDQPLVDRVSTEEEDDDDEDENPVDRVLSEPEDHTAILTLVEQKSTPPHLSTLTISTTSRRSGLGHTIAYFLRRHHQVPVVGDRFAASEYLALPRAMRNRVKQRWCLGCTAVALVGHEDRYRYQDPVPDQWSARYWEDFGQNAHRNDKEEEE
jgi:Domain of unknown function (DUF2431)